MKNLNKHKLFLFKISAFVGVIVIFILIEILLRLFTPSFTKDNLIDIGNLSFFTPVSVRGEKYIKITNKLAYSEQNNMFREKKESNTKRIFCIGGSACAGWPHPPDERFSAYLQLFLEKTFPQQKIEVINCGAHGFASYRVLKVFQAILPYSPDAVIVWCGNNEFLEERKYFTSGLMKVLDEVAGKIKTVQVLKQLFSKPQLDGNELKVTKSFWKKVQQESLDLRSEPELFEKVKIHYRTSLESIAKEGSQYGVKTIFFSVPVNLRDWEPNVSCNTLKGNDSLVWLNSYNTGRANLLKNDYREARDYFISALKNEPLHAHSYFLLARSFDLLNDTLQALEYYSRARDLDYNPFRALTCFNEIVKDVACKNSGAFYYNADSLFKVNSKSGIPGFDLFLDYVHPTRAGNLLLAVNFAKYLRLTNILDLSGSGLEIPEQDYEEMLTNYSDEKDEQLQITKFSLFCLTHQYKSAHNLGEWILSNFSQSYLNNNFNQHEVLKLKEGLAAINSYLAEDEALLLGKGNMERMSAAKLMLKNFYAKYYPYGSY